MISTRRRFMDTNLSLALGALLFLSVSISAITSPALIRSPSCFSQRARLPSVMVGESAGIRIFVAMVLIPYRR